MNLRRASGIAFGLMLLAVLGVPGQPGGEKGKDGKKGPPPFELGRVLPPFVRNDLELTEDQRKQIADLEKEVLTKLQTILTKDQLKRIQDMGAKGGKGPPDGKGKDTGPLLLQDHSGFKGAPNTTMRFRNIWIRELK